MDGKSTILIVGEETGISPCVKSLGARLMVVGQPQEALAKVTRTRPSLVLINLPGSTLEPSILRALSNKGRPILILADLEDISPPNGQSGKIQILRRPVEPSELRKALQMALDDTLRTSHVRPTAGHAAPQDQYLKEYAPLLDKSPAMQAIKEIIERVSDTTATVLIRGESGVGKDLVARAIHTTSRRSGRPFIKVNCAALPADLLESELFGHEKGAFTGAYRRKLGKFEFAHTGTLFLDEIGELPLALQAKLLHVLQDQEFSRVGGRDVIRVDTRVVASTNRDLEAALTSGQFREDLYYRLNVVEIRVPPLRERRDEIPHLIAYFLNKFQRQYGRRVAHPPDLFKGFPDYRWPGNVRELENVVRRLVVLGSAPSLPEERPARPPEVEAAPARPPQGEASMGLREIARRAAREAERRAIQEVLERVRWNRTKAARLLKISYKTMLTKIAECGVAPRARRSSP